MKKQSGKSGKPDKPKPTKGKDKAAGGAKPKEKESAGKVEAKKKGEKTISVEKQKDNERLIAENRKARFEYFVLDSLECGIILQGSEVKSLRQGKCSIEEAYGRIKDGDVWLINCDIQEYTFANQLNHLPKRPRKLLLHKREVAKFAAKANDRGLTLVPLRMYFKEGKAKVLLAVCRGKRLHDKREAVKKAGAQREIQRALRGK
jgi:SsrA-binding protein